MINNKKGLSTIVVTVIMIALVLVAIGIVWAVVNNLLDKGTESVDFNSVCLKIDVKPIAVSCTGTPADCTVTLERTGQGTEAIDGVKVVFKDANDVSSPILDVPGNIDVLATKTTASLATTLTDPVVVDTVVYFIDDFGESQYCVQTQSYEF